jgi:hypothetical protein
MDSCRSRTIRDFDIAAYTFGIRLFPGSHDLFRDAPKNSVTRSEHFKYSKEAAYLFNVVANNVNVTL